MDTPSRKRVRKDAAEIENAVKEVLETNSSVRSVAKSYGIAKSFLARLVNKAKTYEDLDSFVYKPNIGNRKIFSVEEEIALVGYLKTTSKMSYGLTYTQTRQLAYDYAINLEKVIPISWAQNKTGSSDWMKGFMQRHKDLSLRRPEKTSLARATAFNKNTVAFFYDNLRNVLTKYKFGPGDIYNGDETGLCTVTELPNVIGERGTKQIGQATSAERGQLVTMLAFVSAAGNTVPPVFIFPRVQFKDFMIQDSPPGSLGLTHISGWMTSKNFFKAFQHFVKHVKPTQDQPVLLLMDNHDSHISLDVVIHARENGVILLTFPPHCSHRLQPLDVAVFGPFKSFFKAALNDWMVSNAGKTATIYHLPKFATASYGKSFTIKNITSGFQKAGIFPFNSENFSEEDFLSAYVTDRPLETENATEINTPNEPLPGCSMTPSTSSSTLENADEALPVSQTTLIVTSPEMVRPFPKAAARKANSNRGRKRGSSRILTDTPEKNQIAVEQQQKEEKLRKKAIKKQKQLKRQLLALSSSEESDVEVQYDESDANEELEFYQDEEVEDEIEELRENDFILVKLTKKDIVKYAVAQILKLVEHDEFSVKFMEKSKKTCNFKFPEKKDLADVNKKHIVMKLPMPYQHVGSERVRGFYSFSIDLSQFIGLI